MIDAGSKIGNYKVTRLLGEGGMGRVFEGIHEQIGRRAAIKVLHAQFAHNSEAYTRFLNEARAVNIIQHPGLVNVFEFGQTEDGSPYIVMEFLEGETLADRLASVGRMSMGALRIARQIASALMAAHAKHIVHRDLKPANVMLVPDPDMPGGERVKVVDFGIAKISAEHNDTGYKTRAGAILGTPTYMSPEQCRGAGEVTDKTDVYALGVMIYEMLVGRPPFVAEGGGEIMGMHLFQAPPPLHMLEPTLPLDLVDLVHSMLSKDPDARPSIVQVAQELDRIGGRLSGPMQAVSAEVAAMAAEPKPPGPLTIPIDLRRQAQVTSVSHAPATTPSSSSQPGAASSQTPAQPFVPVHPMAAPITPSHYTPAPGTPYITPAPYSPYITPSHYAPPYVTPSHYAPAPITPSGLTPPLAPPPAPPPPVTPSQMTPPLAPPPHVAAEPAVAGHAAGPLSPATTQILSSGTTPVSQPAAAPTAPSAATPVLHPSPAEPPLAPVTASAAGPAQPASPADAAPSRSDHAAGLPGAAVAAETATLVAADSTREPEPSPGSNAALASPVPNAAAPVQALAASDSGPIKASPHAPTIGVSQSSDEAAAPTTPLTPTLIPSAPTTTPTAESLAGPAEPAPPTTTAQSGAAGDDAKPLAGASPGDKSPSLAPMSTAVVASAAPIRPVEPGETDDKRALKIVLGGLAAAAVILVAGLVIGLTLRQRGSQPAAGPDAATSAPSEAAPQAQPVVDASTGSPQPSPAPPDLGSARPDLAAPTVGPGPAPAVDAGTGEGETKVKKKKALQRRKKGLRNEEIEYLD